jgi:hypothetical protein
MGSQLGDGNYLKGEAMQIARRVGERDCGACHDDLACSGVAGPPVRPRETEYGLTDSRRRVAMVGAELGGRSSASSRADDCGSSIEKSGCMRRAEFGTVVLRRFVPAHTS